MKRPLRLVVAIESPEVQARVLKLLGIDNATNAIELENVVYDLDLRSTRSANDDSTLTDSILAAASSENGASVLVVSDHLHAWHPSEDGDVLAPNAWYKSLKDDMRDQSVEGRCVAIALMKRPNPIDDVDRVLSEECSRADLLGKMQRCVDKLDYLEPPESSPRRECNPRVRPLRLTTELCDYFRLRHEVYSIMCYLDEEVESAPSKMEICWSDRIALHLGAFAKEAGRPEQLVGTARVVIATSRNAATELVRKKHARAVEQLASNDPVLVDQCRLALELELPIFYSSNEMQHLAIETLQQEQEEVCAELSRVIVKRNYRGLGIGKDLVRQAISHAKQAGVERMFLECLGTHVSMYRRHGFRLMQHGSGNVIQVKYTMFGMELDLAGVAAATP